jgi:alkyl hydroperoxide reductase subunit AhpC
MRSEGAVYLSALNENMKEQTPVITEGTAAPGFSLNDQFGRKIALDDFRDKQHVLLVFYPLDWTPT